MNVQKQKQKIMDDSADKFRVDMQAMLAAGQGDAGKILSSLMELANSKLLEIHTCQTINARFLQRKHDAVLALATDAKGDARAVNWIEWTRIIEEDIPALLRERAHLERYEQGWLVRKGMVQAEMDGIAAKSRLLN